MKACKTCGNVIEGVQGQNTCPACAIVNVLQGDWDYLPAPIQFPVKESSPLVAQLAVCDNFFEKYQILEALDDGGQGQVWKVWDYEFRRELAMKGLSEEMTNSHSACYRFLAEAQITSQLKHPGILPVYDAGLDLEGRPFYTTELSTGARLDEKFAELKGEAWTKPALNTALEIMVRICEIMGHVHSRGVIHRDLKPSNVLVGEFGDVRIIDWGSAAVLKKDSNTIEEPFVEFAYGQIHTDRHDLLAKRPDLATAIEGWPSTPVFTAPEMLAGNVGDVSAQTDIYSIGVILYQLLTGLLPFVGDDPSLSPAEIKRRVINHEIISIRRLNPKSSRDLEAISIKAMAFDKSRRYQSMQDLAADLRAAIELRPVQARNPGLLLKIHRLLQRYPGQAALGGLILLIVVSGFLSMRNLKAQKNVARQVQALESAELARRSGHWREALQHLDEAEASGYSDAVALGLKRAEAWTVLNEPDRSKAELEKLQNVPDKDKGAVLLRKGEHTLFDAQNSDQGVQLVNAALVAGLDPADDAFAKGLIASTAPEALKRFHQALVLDPYHHGAHIYLLGLEFLMGLHQELATEIYIYRALYPEDLSPVYIQACEFALDGRLDDAEQALSLAKGQTHGDVYRRLETGLRLTAAMAASLDPDNFAKSLETNQDQPLMQMKPVAASRLTGAQESIYPSRMPHLPCVTSGLMDAYTSVKSLGIGLLSQPVVAVHKIESAHQIYPEALPPLLGGILLEGRKPQKGIDRQRLCTMQAELFELAANSASMFPNVPRLARFLAARSQFELATNSSPANSEAAQSCLKNISAACAGGGCSAGELGAYLDFAMGLKDYDLARTLLRQLEKIEPHSVSVKHSRVNLELAVGALDEAQRAIDQMLKIDPAEAWALNRKAVLIQKLKAVPSTSPSSPGPGPD